MNLHAASAIVQADAPVLRARAKPLAKKDLGSRELAELIANMRRLLATEENGVGLAAPQVGVPVRLFIVAGRVFEEDSEEEPVAQKKSKKTASEAHPGDRAFINPEIIRMSRKKKGVSEGCLSVHGRYGTVLRHEKATVRALDQDGTPFTYHATELLAQIFQHEMDHLDGVLFIDKATALEDEKKRSK